MYNFDDILQSKLDALENGQSVESVLAALPAEAKELEPLIRLAAAVRTVPHPEPFAAHLAAQREQVMAAARLNTRPITRPAVHPPQRTVSNGFGIYGTARMLGAVGAAAVMFVLVVVGLGFWFSNRAASSVRVESITGQVMVATNADGTNWKNINAGDRLNAGQRIRSLGASNATLVFYEGSRTLLSANGDLVLSKVGRAGSSLQVELTQKSGDTTNRVVPLKGSQGFFLVHTPTGTASVHGTIFNVIVGQSGQTVFAVNKGEVRVKNDGSEVTLRSGQATSAGLSGSLAEPNYQFSIVGSLMSKQPDTWTVSGLVFQISEQSEISEEFEIGSTVEVTGRVLADGSRVADSIKAAVDSDQTASFTGTLEAMKGEIWQISGTDVKITDETALDATLAVGDPVKVTFNLLDDDTWLALIIESLVERAEDPLPTATATAVPNALPGYQFQPDEIEIANCNAQTDFNLTGSLTNTASAAKDYAANVQLGYLIDRGGEYVSGVELSPAGWTRIEPGQTVNFSIHLAATPEFANLQDDAEIKLRIFIASATNRPDHLDGRMTVSISAGCKLTPTPNTVTLTLVPTVGTATPNQTGTPAVIPTLLQTPAVPTYQTGLCTGADPQPTGMKLAQRYGVSYEEIMGWFCQHYGFGEIDLAYSLSRQSGLSVAEIFAMRSSNAGWGAIKQQLAPDDNHSGNKDKGNDKGKGNDKPKKDH